MNNDGMTCSGLTDEELNSSGFKTWQQWIQNNQAEYLTFDERVEAQMHDDLVRKQEIFDSWMKVIQLTKQLSEAQRNFADKLKGVI